MRLLDFDKNIGHHKYSLKKRKFTLSSRYGLKNSAATCLKAKELNVREQNRGFSDWQDKYCGLLHLHILGLMNEKNKHTQKQKTTQGSEM